MNLFNDLFSLAGRKAVVTGGGSGLGAEIATTLARAGAHVILVGRRADYLDEVAERIHELGCAAATIPSDLSEDEGLNRVVEMSMVDGKSVDILVNAAGMNLRSSAEDVDLDEWNNTLHLNLAVPFFLAQALIGGMKASGWGRILNIGSIQSVRALPNSIPYGASKGGIVQLTRAMAQAWSRFGITCNAIAPGLFPTELTQSIYTNHELVQEMAEKTCCGRNAELSDIHGLSLFLASPSAAFLTGQTIFVDGGLTAR